MKTNNTPVTRLLPQKDEDYKSTAEFQFEQTTLENVAVGDIIKVHDGEQVPADCVLLKVKDNAKECFVKTAALDGERNLKPKLVNEEFIANIPLILDPVDNHQFPHMSLDCIKPMKALYTFKGRVTIKEDE